MISHQTLVRIGHLFLPVPGLAEMDSSLYPGPRGRAGRWLQGGMACPALVFCGGQSGAGSRLACWDLSSPQGYSSRAAPLRTGALLTGKAAAVAIPRAPPAWIKALVSGAHPGPAPAGQGTGGGRKAEQGRAELGAAGGVGGSREARACSAPAPQGPLSAGGCGGREGAAGRPGGAEAAQLFGVAKAALAAGVPVTLPPRCGAPWPRASAASVAPPPGAPARAPWPPAGHQRPGSR